MSFFGRRGGISAILALLLLLLASPSLAFAHAASQRDTTPHIQFITGGVETIFLGLPANGSLPSSMDRQVPIMHKHKGLCIWSRTVTRARMPQPITRHSSVPYATVATCSTCLVIFQPPLTLAMPTHTARCGMPSLTSGLRRPSRRDMTSARSMRLSFST